MKTKKINKLGLCLMSMFFLGACQQEGEVSQAQLEVIESSSHLVSYDEVESSLRAGDYNRAKQLINRAIQSLDKSQQEEVRTQFEYFVNAFEAYRLGDLDKADEIIAKVDLDNDVVIFNSLITNLTQDITEAQVDLTVFKEKLNQANQFFQAGDYDEAYVISSELIEKSNDRPSYQNLTFESVEINKAARDAKVDESLNRQEDIASDRYLAQRDSQAIGQSFSEDKGYQIADASDESIKDWLSTKEGAVNYIGTEESPIDVVSQELVTPTSSSSQNQSEPIIAQVQAPINSDLLQPSRSNKQVELEEDSASTRVSTGIEDPSVQAMAKVAALTGYDLQDYKYYAIANEDGTYQVEVRQPELVSDVPVYHMVGLYQVNLDSGQVTFMNYLTGQFEAL